METETFKRVLTLGLDTLDVDIIFTLLFQLRDILKLQYSTFQSLSIQDQKFSLWDDFIPLTFTEKVDTRTVPVTDCSDAELQTLMVNVKMRNKNATRYIDAHTELYAPTLSGKLISIVVPPDTGKTFYCKGLMNEFTNSISDAYRFVLLITCRNRAWNNLEKQYRTSPEKISDIITRFLRIVCPKLKQSEELIEFILRTEGNDFF